MVRRTRSATDMALNCPLNCPHDNVRWDYADARVFPGEVFVPGTCMDCGTTLERVYDFGEVVVR